MIDKPMEFKDEEGKTYVLGHSDIKEIIEKTKENNHNVVRNNHLRYIQILLTAIAIVMFGLIIWTGVLTNIGKGVFC